MTLDEFKQRNRLPLACCSFFGLFGISIMAGLLALAIPPLRSAFGCIAIMAGGITVLRVAILGMVLPVMLLASPFVLLVQWLWPKIVGSGRDAAVEPVARSSDRTERIKPFLAYYLVFGTNENLLEAGIPAMIFICCSVWALPLLSPWVNQAQYEREGIPAVSSIRIEVELFRIEKEHMPGLGRGSDGSLAQTSRLVDGLSGVQTFCHSDTAEYAVYAADFGRVIAVTNGNHAFRETDVGYADLTGSRVRPKHFQYRVDACESEKYLYTVGVFGDDDGLKAGTGYAVMEFNNVSARVTAVGTWERYKPLAKEPKQIIMVNAEEARRYFNCETPEQAAKINLCCVGDSEALMSGDKARVERALEELRKAGWEW